MQCGEIAFTFTKKGSVLEIGRASFADFLLKHNKIENFIKQEFKKELQPYNYEQATMMIGEFEIILLQGKRKTLQLRVQKNIFACCWHDKKANALYFALERSSEDLYMTQNIKKIFGI
jgi:hypothetical protein